MLEKSVYNRHTDSCALDGRSAKPQNDVWDSHRGKQSEIRSFGTPPLASPFRLTKGYRLFAVIERLNVRMMNVTQLMLGINIVVAVVEIAIRLQGKSVAARWRMKHTKPGAGPSTPPGRPQTSAQ